MTTTPPVITVPMELIEDAANILAWRGYWEPDDDDADVPASMVAELTEIAQTPCGVCTTEDGMCRGPDYIADHYQGRRQDEYERSIPVWTCTCGQPLKVIASQLGIESFFLVVDDGLVGEHVGDVKRDSQDRIKKLDECPACPGCGNNIARTITDQANPQAALF